jgi:uncharacterized protein (TIGR02145 family)
MKNKIYKIREVLIITLVNLFISSSIFAQVPEKMSYQSVIRNSNNQLIINQEVGLQISIIQDSTSGTAIYVESQTPFTNENGLISIEIGGGEGFNTIDWSDGTYFIKTEIDPSGGTNYTITGISQLLSVPYALHAKTADNLDELIKQIEELQLFTGIYKDAKDADGNVYKTVTIGSQVWMAENLKTTKYNTGEEIPLISDNTEWSNLTTGAYCWYNNDSAAYENPYGKLYNWYTVNTGILCPLGWHIPTNAEWIVLADYLGGVLVAGGKIKETGTVHWLSPNVGATNESGFTGLPGGIRYNNGTFGYMNWNGFGWSSTEYDSVDALYRDYRYDNPYFGFAHYPKKTGFSIRCIKD